jgi:TnpA family transposase
VTHAPVSVVNYVASQLGVSPDDLAVYGDRSQTRTDHLQAIQAYLGFRKASDSDFTALSSWLLERALEHDKPTVLLQLACDNLRAQRIVRPGLTIIEKFVTSARNQATDRIFTQLAPMLTRERKQFLDALLVPDATTNRTSLSWLRRRATANSAPEILEGLKKLVFLREHSVEEWHISDINPNRAKLLAQLGRKSTNQMLQRMASERRYPILLLFLTQTLVDITDEIVDLFDRCFMDTYARARRNLDEFRKLSGRSTNEKVIFLGKLCAILTDPENTASPEQLFANLYESFSLEELKSIWQECDSLARPLDDYYFDFWAKRYVYFRIFSREFIKTFQFYSNRANDPILEGLTILATLNEQERRKVPDDAPTSFVTPKWQQYVFDKKGKIDRHYWELCLLWELRNNLRSGDIWLLHSRRYANPESYLVPSEQWVGLKREVCQQIQAPSDGDTRLQERIGQVHELLSQADQLLSGKNGTVRIENGRLIISPLEAEVLPERVLRLQQIVSERLPKVDLSDLLIEVDRWTHFTGEFEHAGGAQPRKNGLLVHLYASILSQACNFGLTQMADIAHLSYEQLSWTTNWYLREETLKAATTRLVNYHYHQPLARAWGGGTLSSSDGQRFPATVESKRAVALPRYFGYGRGLTFYTWTSDQFSQYGSKPIPSTVRDATYVLDEILDNETELDIVEHTTDTAGYTEIVFGLFDLLGLRFSPRLRDIADQRIYRIDKAIPYRTIEPLLKGKLNPKIILEHYDDFLRVAGSLKLGWVTASLLISKLKSYPQQNSLTRALMEYGRLVKTQFILQYLLSETVRHDINRQLNKGEAIHALRRFLFFANEGKIRKSQDEAQNNQVGCLNFVTNAVILWTTVYMQEILHQLRKEGYKVIDEDLKHLSPARYGHVNPYGNYEFNVDVELSRTELRPLRGR